MSINHRRTIEIWQKTGNIIYQHTNISQRMMNDLRGMVEKMDYAMKQWMHMRYLIDCWFTDIKLLGVDGLDKDDLLDFDRFYKSDECCIYFHSLWIIEKK